MAILETIDWAHCPFEHSVCQWLEVRFFKISHNTLSVWELIENAALCLEMISHNVLIGQMEFSESVVTGRDLSILPPCSRRWTITQLFFHCLRELWHITAQRAVIEMSNMSKQRPIQLGAPLASPINQTHTGHHSHMTFHLISRQILPSSLKSINSKLFNLRPRQRGCNLIPEGKAKRLNAGRLSTLSIDNLIFHMAHTLHTATFEWATRLSPA